MVRPWKAGTLRLRPVTLQLMASRSRACEDDPDRSIITGGRSNQDPPYTQKPTYYNFLLIIFGPYYYVSP